ncbi:hypothetical protein [Lactiplantibacillus plantarum]|nr:hypothetical protein [Lactiplantibacillus plantarum]
MSNADYQSKTGAQQTETIISTITDNLAGKMTAVESSVTDDSNKL